METCFTLFIHSGINTYNIFYCNGVSICCPMSRGEASSAFVGFMPECGRVNGGAEICFKICHPND